MTDPEKLLYLADWLECRGWQSTCCEVKDLRRIADRLEGKPEWFCQCGGINTQNDLACRSCHRIGQKNAAGIIDVSRPDAGWDEPKIKGVFP